MPAQTVCGPFSGIPPVNGTTFELTGELSHRLSYRHTIKDLRKNGIRLQKQLGDDIHSAAAWSGKNAMPTTPPFNASNLQDQPNEDSSTGNSIIVRDCDDPYRSPSCVLVQCEARGAGLSARLVLRSRLFTPASWAAWCDDADVGAAAPTDGDIGRPRAAPQWATTAEGGGGGSGEGREGGGATATATADDVIAALSDEGGPAEVIAEAFERLLDVEEDEDEDEALAVARGGTADATRRVFDSLTWVYDHVRVLTGLIC